MCGRFTLHTPAESVAELFDLPEVPNWAPRYNIAPTQRVPVVSVGAEGGGRSFRTLTWGLVPSWSRDPKMGARMINARGETVQSKPSFRAAFRQRRCLILADGFYEWKRIERGKQPYFISMGDGRPFALAGLWERWKPPDGEPLDTCTIITTQPNELLEPIHDRMPVILDASSYDEWMDPDHPDPERLGELLRPFSSQRMTAFPISKQVNSPSNDSPECIEPLASWP